MASWFALLVMRGECTLRSEPRLSTQHPMDSLGLSCGRESHDTASFNSAILMCSVRVTNQHKFLHFTSFGGTVCNRRRIATRKMLHHGVHEHNGSYGTDLLMPELEQKPGRTISTISNKKPPSNKNPPCFPGFLLDPSFSRRRRDFFWQKSCFRK
mgnify:CR=1 FL=1